MKKMRKQSMFISTLPPLLQKGENFNFIIIVVQKQNKQTNI